MQECKISLGFSVPSLMQKRKKRDKERYCVETITNLQALSVWRGLAWWAQQERQQGFCEWWLCSHSTPPTAPGDCGPLLHSGRWYTVDMWTCTVIMLDIFESGMTYIRWWKWFMETSWTITVISQIHGCPYHYQSFTSKHQAPYTYTYICKHP